MSARSRSGWGLTAPSITDERIVPSDELPAVVAAIGRRGAIARGLGRSYGDSAQNGGGTTIRVAERDVVVEAERGVVTAAAGASLDELLHHLVPAGFFVPVSPGTRYVTVGGAIASDIHGKNHHVDGTFGNHVESLTLQLADGSVVEIGPQRDPELFWATIGGMGLTGIIVAATFRVLPIETSWCSVDTERIADLDHLLDRMSDGDDDYRYSVAWIDLMARGKNLGRSVLTRGEHARREELSPRQSADPLRFDPRPAVTLPAGLDRMLPRRGVLTPATVATFNEAWFRKAPRHRVAEVVTLSQFFHPLDAVRRWNRLYGRHGFVQYQFVVPFGETVALRRVIERLADSKTTSFLAVLKRFGAANQAPLSFPRPGWTLALDIPAASGGLAELFADLDEIVLTAGGRHYLAKDSATTPDAIRRGYPRLQEWQRVRDRVDPHRRWVSDQARRLQLIAPPADDRGER